MYVGVQKVPTTGKMRSWNSLPVRKTGARGRLYMEFVYPEKYGVVASNRQESIQQSRTLCSEQKQSTCCRCFSGALCCPVYISPILCACVCTTSQQIHHIAPQCWPHVRQGLAVWAGDAKMLRLGTWYGLNEYFPFILCQSDVLQEL